MILNKENLFFLLSIFLIFSNKFAFVIFFCENRRIKRFFGNALSKKIYNFSRVKQGGGVEDLTPVNLAYEYVKEVDVTSAVKRFSVKRGNALEHFEEITINLENDNFAKSQIVIKFCFVEAFSLQLPDRNSRIGSRGN